MSIDWSVGCPTPVPLNLDALDSIVPKNVYTGGYVPNLCQPSILYILV